MHVKPERLVAANVAYLRAARGLTQRQFLTVLQERCGVRLEQAAFSRKESGVRPISLQELFTFAAVLDVAPSTLLLPREPSGTLALSKTVTLDFTVVRAWLRARRTLFTAAPPEQLELGDEAAFATIGQLAAHVTELRDALATAQQHIDQARSDLGSYHASPQLFADERTKQLRAAARAQLDAALIRHAEILQQLHDHHTRIRETIETAVTDGWLDDTDAQTLLADLEHVEDTDAEYRR